MHKILSLLFMVVLVILVTPSCPHRILFVPCVIPSYLHEYEILGQALMMRGHDVYIVVPDTIPALKSVTNIITYKGRSDEVSATSEEMQKKLSQVVFKDSKQQLDLTMETSEMFLRDCHLMMDDQQFLSHVGSLKFDFALASSVYSAPCSAILPHNLSIPYATMSSFSGISWLTRAPNLPSFVPSMMAKKHGDRMGFFQRLQNLVDHVSYFPGLPATFPGVTNTSLLQKYAPEIHSWVNLLERSELFIVPKDHHLSWPMPLLPNIITVAGITPGPAKPLTGQIKHLIDNAKEGVIVVSFGTMFGHMSQDLARKFMKAFQQIKQLVIWKSNPTLESHFLNLPDNVKLIPWIPQNDLLGHEKVKLFITHCGNNGLHEALYHGVSMIGFPYFGDQQGNSFSLESRGFGIGMDILSFTSASLVQNIREILNNKSYEETMRQISGILRDQPMSGRDKVCHWIEHVIKYGGAHLRTGAFELSWLEYFMVDILLFLCCITCLMLLFIYCAVRYCLKLRFRKFKEKVN